MRPTSSQHRQYLRTLNEKILPWLKNGNPTRLFLAEPPVALPPGVTRLNIRSKIKRERRNLPSTLRQHRWISEGLETMRFVEIGCVLEGEVDYLIGAETDSDADVENSAYEVQALTLPERTFFVVPPGIARPDGSRPHWERPQPEQAHSQIFWLLFLPSGAKGHFCASEGLRHINKESFFIRDNLLEFLVSALLEELRAHNANSELAARGLLFTIMTRVARALAAGQSLAAVEEEPESELPVSDLSPIVRQACMYIQSHLHQPLSLPSIAVKCYVSPSHLSRCFRKEMGESVMGYVMHSRIQAAKKLLLNRDMPDLSVQAISSMVGFATPEYFTRTFTRAEKMSPTRYRESQ